MMGSLLDVTPRVFASHGSFEALNPSHSRLVFFAPTPKIVFMFSSPHGSFVSSSVLCLLQICNHFCVFRAFSSEHFFSLCGPFSCWFTFLLLQYRILWMFKFHSFFFLALKFCCAFMLLGYLLVPATIISIRCYVGYVLFRIQNRVFLSCINVLCLRVCFSCFAGRRFSAFLPCICNIF
jgi:hypothetical protein